MTQSNRVCAPVVRSRSVRAAAYRSRSAIRNCRTTLETRVELGRYLGASEGHEVVALEILDCPLSLVFTHDCMEVSLEVIIDGPSNETACVRPCAHEQLPPHGSRGARKHRRCCGNTVLQAGAVTLSTLKSRGSGSPNARAAKSGYLAE